MLLSSRIEPGRLMGRSPERLSIAELTAMAGKVVALEVYTPETTPIRTIQAIGDSAEECVAQLKAKGADPRQYEFIVLKTPY